MSDDAPWLIVVTGYPGVGKTTLAQHLSRELVIPLIAKDAVKERLFDVLGTGDLEWSHLLGRASLVVLFDQVQTVLGIGHSIIAEANFDAELSTRDLARVVRETGARPLRVVLHADADALLDRCRQRAESGQRHPGHIDEHLLAELESIARVRYEPPDLPGPRFDIDATDLEAVDADAITALVRQAMETA